MNIYNYVSGDPVNFVDPFGLKEEELPTVTLTGTRKRKNGSASGASGTGRTGGVSGGGGSFGGGGSTGTWETQQDRPLPKPNEEVIEVIVVTGTRVATAPQAPRRNAIHFGYPPEPNSTWHIDKHLPGLTARERQQLRDQVEQEVKANYPNLAPKKNVTGIVVFKGMHYKWSAFGLPNNITNVGTIFHVNPPVTK